MTDASLRDLERRALASDDLADRRAWRLALLRAGREADAGLEVGDVVLARNYEDLPRDGSEFSDDYPAIVASIQSRDFTQRWPWRSFATHPDARILGLLPLPPIRMAAIFFPCAQDGVRLVEPNRFSWESLAAMRYAEDGIYKHDGFLFGFESRASTPQAHLGPWEFEVGELRCLAWERVREGRIDARGQGRLPAPHSFPWVNFVVDPMTGVRGETEAQARARERSRENVRRRPPRRLR